VTHCLPEVTGQHAVDALGVAGGSRAPGAGELKLMQNADFGMRNGGECWTPFRGPMRLGSSPFRLRLIRRLVG
jgi:hypothetical protein